MFQDQMIRKINKLRMCQHLNKVYYNCKITIHVKNLSKKWDKPIFFHVMMKISMMSLVINQNQLFKINLNPEKRKMMMKMMKVKLNQLKENHKVKKERIITIIIIIIITIIIIIIIIIIMKIMRFIRNLNNDHLGE